MHRRWDSGLEKAFINHLDCLRADTEITQYLFKSYCEAFLGAKSFEEADTDTMVKERERLQQWFKKMDWSELRDPRQLEKMAFKLSYLRVSRTEIYDVFGVLLLLEQLDERLRDVKPTAMLHSSKPIKPKKTVKKKSVENPMTLKYYKHGNNGVLNSQRQRVHIVFKKWTDWGWIDKNTSPDDFDAFFEGKPRHCNIIWKGNSTILTILMKELLQQPYIEKQKGCAAKSLVKQQFKKTANFDWSRIDKGIEDKIQISIIVLNIDNPLPKRPGRNMEEEVDIRDAALQAIYSGLLRSTKGI